MEVRRGRRKGGRKREGEDEMKRRGKGGREKRETKERKKKSKNVKQRSHVGNSETRLTRAGPWGRVPVSGVVLHVHSSMGVISKHAKAPSTFPYILVLPVFPAVHPRSPHKPSTAHPIAQPQSLPVEMGAMVGQKKKKKKK